MCSETKEELEVAQPQPDIFEPKKEKKHKNKPLIVFNSKEEELVFKAERRKKRFSMMALRDADSSTIQKLSVDLQSMRKDESAALQLNGVQSEVADSVARLTAKSSQSGIRCRPMVRTQKSSLTQDFRKNPKVASTFGGKNSGATHRENKSVNNSRAMES